MELKGKPLSLAAKLAGALIVLLALGLKAFNLTPAITMDDAIKAAAFVVVIFAPIDVSIWIQHVFGRR